MATVTAKSADEKRWQAESDAETLMRAVEIKAEPDRLKRALAILREKAKAQKEALAEAATEAGGD